MDPFIFVVPALLLGLAIGWFLGSRPAPLLRTQLSEALEERNESRAATEEWREKFSAAIRDLAAEQKTAERVGTLEEELRQERLRAGEFAAKIAAFERGEAERLLAHTAQLDQLKDLKTQVEKQFGELANRALNEAQGAFLKRADDRFAQAGKESEANLKLLLQPVETLLKGQDESLAKVEKERVDQYAGLVSAIEQMNKNNDLARLETSRLSGVLRSSPKARGRWGEEQLRNVLESAGLAPNVDFHLQTSRFEEGQQFRPDCIINLPGDKCIVVDVKCPLTAFEKAYDEENEELRSALLLEHANAMRTYANDLGKKSYFDKFDNTPDFVILYVPGEHFLSAAAERLPNLIGDAFKNKVVIASTINLLALAKMMAWMWRQEHAAREARQFVETGKKLHTALRTMADKIIDLGTKIERTNVSYNAFIASLEGNVLIQAKKLDALDTMYGEPEMPDLKPVTSPIRPLVKLSASTADNVE